MNIYMAAELLNLGTAATSLSPAPDSQIIQSHKGEL